MKIKHYLLLLLVVATLLVSCPGTSSPSYPYEPTGPAMPAEPEAPTTDVEEVEMTDGEATPLTEMLNGLINLREPSDATGATKLLFTVDKEVEVGDDADKVKITYNKDSYTSNE